jgi:hypothetical protein
VCTFITGDTEFSHIEQKYAFSWFSLERKAKKKGVLAAYKAKSLLLYMEIVKYRLHYF